MKPTFSLLTLVRAGRVDVPMWAARLGERRGADRGAGTAHGGTVPRLVGRVKGENFVNAPAFVRTSP